MTQLVLPERAGRRRTHGWEASSATMAGLMVLTMMPGRPVLLTAAVALAFFAWAAVAALRGRRSGRERRAYLDPFAMGALTALPLIGVGGHHGASGPITGVLAGAVAVGVGLVWVVARLVDRRPSDRREAIAIRLHAAMVALMVGSIVLGGHA